LPYQTELLRNKSGLGSTFRYLFHKTYSHKINSRINTEQGTVVSNETIEKL